MTSPVVVRVVDVYAYRLSTDRRVEFLMLKRSEGRPYEGAWRMIGGKIEVGETAWQAALRELLEETRLQPVRFWSVPSVNAFYEWQHDRVNVIPVFAAQVDADPHLDEEHTVFSWLDAAAAGEAVRWPEQQRMMRLIDDLLRKPLADDWLIPISGERI